MEPLVIHYVFSLKIRGSLVIHYGFGNSGGICSSSTVYTRTGNPHLLQSSSPRLPVPSYLFYVRTYCTRTSIARSHGSTGNSQDPGKVWKGKKMAGHMGDARVTVQNLIVVSTDL